MNNRLREFRSRLNMTQEQLADRLGVSRQTVISVENGRYNPSLTLAYKMARVFSCSIEDIFDFSEVETDE